MAPNRTNPNDTGTTTGTGTFVPYANRSNNTIHWVVPKELSDYPRCPVCKFFLDRKKDYNGKEYQMCCSCGHDSRYGPHAFCSD
jgi:hypothetical protein